MKLTALRETSAAARFSSFTEISRRWLGIFSLLWLAACAGPQENTRESARDSSREDILVPFESSDPAVRAAAFRPPIALSTEELMERAFMQLPNLVIESFLEQPAIELDGQTLHPKLQLEFQERAKARAQSDGNYLDRLMNTWKTTAGKQALRQAAERNWVKMAFDVGTVGPVKDVQIPGPNGPIRARIYWPETAAGGVKPALLYFHGGAFLMSSIESVEPQAKILAREGDMIVVSVDYRLAPENRFPAAHEDALAAFEWLVANAESLGSASDRLGVGGDSAGGNLSIVIADEQVRRGGVVPKAALLYYPFTDAYTENYRSYELFGNGFGLDQDFIRMATDMVLADPKDKDHRWMRPLYTVDFARQPPAVVATAGFDPIRDQGIAFAQKLAAAGVQTIHKHYPSLNHGYLETSGTIDDAYIACFETAKIFGELMHQASPLP